MIQSSEKKAELETLRRLGFRWAVLVSLKNDLTRQNIMLPYEITRDLRLIRSMFESGCYSSCDIVCMLDAIERHIVPKALTEGNGRGEKWFSILGKAMGGNLTLEELKNLPYIRPLMNGCDFLTCSCT